VSCLADKGTYDYMSTVSANEREEKVVEQHN